MFIFKKFLLKYNLVFKGTTIANLKNVDKR